MTAARRLSPIALSISLVGVLMAVSLGITGQLLDRNWTMHGMAVFAAAQVAAIVLGLTSRDRLGRATAIAAGLMLGASLLLLS